MQANSNAPEVPDKITQIFNTTVYGGSALVGAANDTTIAFNIIPYDIESLRRALHCVFRGYFRIRKCYSSPMEFGPKVSSWIAGMMKKASEGTWGVGIAAAGNILAKILLKFYGF